jgi:hypothetical protein
VYFRFPIIGVTKTDGTVGKDLKPPYKWQTITRDTMKSHHKEHKYSNGCLYENNGYGIITGQSTNLTVFDFDDKQQWDDMYSAHADEIDTFYRVKTRKGFHIYFNYSPKYNNTQDKNVKIDIRNDGGFIIAPPTKYKMPDGSIIKYEFVGGVLKDVPDWIDDYLNPNIHFVNPPQKQTLKIKIKRERNLSTSSDISNFSSVSQQSDSGISTTTSSSQNVALIKHKLERIKAAIDNGKLDDKIIPRDDWFRVGMIIHHTCDKNPEMLEYGFKIFDTFSRRVQQFANEPEANNRATFNSFANPHNAPITFATFTKWEKEWLKADPSIKIAHSDKEASEIVYEMIKDRLIYSQDALYYRSGIIWRTRMSEIESGLLSFILNSNIYSEDTKGNIINFVQDVPKAKRVREAVIAKAMSPENWDENLYLKFHFTTRNKMCFKNGVYCFVSKTFTKWEDVPPNTIYTTLTTGRNYNPNVNEERKQEIITKIFKPLFDVNCELALAMFSRMISGNPKDKIWMNYIGARNSGKGVCEALFRGAFGEYISALSSDTFIKQGSRKTNDVKEKAHLFQVEFARICFMNEAKDKVEYDGTEIKAFQCGGEDAQITRRNREDPVKIILDAMLVWFNNVGPLINPKDVFVNCFQHTSAHSFKSKEFIEERIADGATQEELATYSIQDEYIKDVFIKQEDTYDALLSIMIDYWKPTKINIPKFDLGDEDEGSNFIAKFYKSFKYTGNENDRVAISVLKDWCDENEIKYKQIQGLLNKCDNLKIMSSRFKTKIIKNHEL